MFNAFNIISKKSWQTNNINNNSGNINSNSSFSFKNNIIFTKSTTTSKTDNLISNRTNNHNNDEENIIDSNMNNNCIRLIDDNISNNSNVNSNNNSMDLGAKNLINLNKINKMNSDNLNKNQSIINKPIIKEKNDSNLLYGNKLFHSGKNIQRKFFSPEQNNKRKKVNIPHLNLGLIYNNQNNNCPKINSFRETVQNKINAIPSSIKSIIIHYDENEYDDNEYYENDQINDYFMHYNIIYTIKCCENKNITCEYNYEKDSVDLIIKNLKEIMNIDANDIILLKNEFGKKINGFMYKKKLQIFF